MNGCIAQSVALTCHGNAFLATGQITPFYPANSTCQFCKSIEFMKVKKRLFRRPKEIMVAQNPDEWIAGLPKSRATGIRLSRVPQNDAGTPDRMLAGFVGCGGTWMMEVTGEDGRSNFWTDRWEVWDPNASDNRIWRVRYGMVGEAQTRPYAGRPISEVISDFRKSLELIHDFSARHDCRGFTECFANALKALNDPSADIGYHKDLAVPNQLTEEATSMLKASMSAWVFGGMGSWNDLGFDGAAQEEYERFSEALFNVLSEAIEAAATSTATF